MIARLGLMLFAGLSLVFFAAACGGDDKTDDGAIATPDSSGLVTIVARDVKFLPEKIIVPAGEMVELRLKNEDGQEHDLQVKDLDVEVMEGGATGAEHQMATPDGGMGMETPEHGGSTSIGQMGPIALHSAADTEESITFTATEKGTYEFWCTITGHKEAGMVGTLTIE